MTCTIPKFLQKRYEFLNKYGFLGASLVGCPDFLVSLVKEADKYGICGEEGGNEDSGPYHASAVTFPGIGGAILQSSGLSLSDSSTGIYSFWFRSAVGTGGPRINAVADVAYIKCPEFSPGTGYIETGFSDDLVFTSFFGFEPVDVAFGTTWHSVQISVDTNHNAGFKVGQCVIDRVLQDSVVYADENGAFNIGWSLLEFGINDTSIDAFDIAEVYFAPGQYLDFSVQANIDKFSNSSNKPISLGADGSLPTGVAPPVYLSGNASEFIVNKGSAGDIFQLTGSLTDATTSPSD